MACGREPGAKPHAQSEKIAQRDRVVCWNGVVKSAVETANDAPVSELGQPVVDGIVETQYAVLDQYQRRYSGGRFAMDTTAKMVSRCMGALLRFRPVETHLAR